MKNLAIITGGSKGLGQALCETYQNQDWQICELSRSGQSEYSTPCDFSQREHSAEIINKLFAELRQTDWSQIHLIHNVARLGQIGPAAHSDPQDWFQSIDVNFSSLVIVAAYFARYFQDHPAQKVLASISSGAAQKNYIGWSLYCSTKAALERFTTCFAEEQKQQEQGICSIIINPGVMDTNMQSEIRASDPEQFPYLERFLELKAHNQLPAPEQVADAIYTITSKQPINGQTYIAAHYFSEKQ